MKNSKKTLVVFMPVFHSGYISLIRKYPDNVCLLGKDFTKDFTPAVRDLRVIDPKILVKVIKSAGLARKVSLLDEKMIKILSKKDDLIVMPKEDISLLIAEKYFSGKKIKYENIFLRWDKIISTTEFIVPENRKKTNDPVHKKILEEAFKEAGKSSDWWRQIGAVVIKDDKILIASHNRHMPTDYHLSIYGDPRSNFNAGERLDIYTSIHGEADIIAKAAKRGISLDGCSLYVTTFPCSNCARLAGEAGIKKVFYSKGYSRLDAEEILASYNVEVFLVE